MAKTITKKTKNNSEEIYHFKSGDTIKVDVNVTEGERSRIQSFRGVVIKIRGTGIGKSFAADKTSNDEIFISISPVNKSLFIVSLDLPTTVPDMQTTDSGFIFSISLK